MINSNYLKGQLSKRGVKLCTEKTFAGNDIRFFVYKGQKIYFDTETPCGGTTFSWTEEQVQNLLFIDYVKEEEQGIYDEIDGETEISFNWGYKEYMLPVQFMGVWKEFEGKICKEIGL